MKTTITQFINGSGNQITVTPEEKRKIKQVREIIKANRKLADRKKAIFIAGFKTKEVWMGSGGVGQVKVLKRTGEIRIQIESGHGSDNHAEAVII